MFRLKINQSVNHNYFFMCTPLRFKINQRRLNKYNWVTNDKKLANNIARAKSNIFNIVSFNKFEYFFTQTIDPIFARSDLKNLIDKFRKINLKLKRLYNADFYYLIIPEYHGDGKNWHLHGFLSSAYGLDSYFNDNGFLSINELDKIGFNSISKIKNYDACTRYITKYITKDLASSINKGDRLYYCSQGLHRNNIVNNFIFTAIPPIHFTFKSEYCFKSCVEKNKYYNFISSIDSYDRIHYYNDM